MNFQTYAKEKRILIEKHLKDFIAYKKNTSFPKTFEDQDIISNLENFALRGKLMRGTLFLFGCQMFGREIDDEILDVAIAIEIAHSSLLIHDDIIDNDLLRRGEKTIFAKYIDRGDEITAIDSAHYGKSIGIVAGDVGFFLAMELFAKAKNIDLLKFYSNEIYMVALAEGVDSELGQIKKEATRDEIFDVYRLKTARYTFSLPLVMAGIISKIPKASIELVDKLGENAGIIFQIKDDELGLFGSEKEIGKPVGSDIRENKKTLIRALLFDKVTNEEKEKLESYFGNSDLDQEKIDEVVALCEKYIVQKELKKETDIIMERVWDLFEKLECNTSYKEMFREFLIFNLERTH